MKPMLAFAPLLLLLVFGSACTFFDTAGPKLTSKSAAQLKVLLESARNELQRNEKELGKTEEQIAATQGMPEQQTASSRLLIKREELKEKVLQSKVNVRELEILLNEE